MAFNNVGVQVADLTAANCLDEVGMMAAAAVTWELFYLFTVFIIHPAACATRDKATAFAVYYDTNAGATVYTLGLDCLASGQAANLKNQWDRFVVQEGNKRIGSIGVINIAESAAERPDPRSQLLLSQCPAAQVHLMDPLVADVAVTSLEIPVPVVMQSLAPQRRICRRTTPLIIIHACRDGLRPFDITDTATQLVT